MNGDLTDLREMTEQAKKLTEECQSFESRLNKSLQGYRPSIPREKVLDIYAKYEEMKECGVYKIGIDMVIKDLDSAIGKVDY